MFYPWLWRKLPGPKIVKLIEATVLFGLVLFMLWFVIFPNIQPWFAGDPAFNG